jgi:hypothetical protein
MVATHLYIGYTYFDGTSNVDVAPFLCISFDTYNGYNQYSFTQTINGTFYEFSVQWNNTTEIWELITVYPTNNLVATIPTQYATAQYPGDIESVYWNVEEDNNENIILDYSIDNEATWNTLLFDVPNTPNTYNWLISSPVSNICKVRARTVSGTLIDKSDDFFTIANLNGIITSPISKTSYCSGESFVVNFTINTICPAYVRTPLVESQIAAQCKEHNLTEQQVIEQIMLAPMPQKAFIGVDEIASTAAFLCEPAARHITAQTLVLDGGWTAR